MHDNIFVKKKEPYSFESLRYIRLIKTKAVFIYSIKIINALDKDFLVHIEQCPDIIYRKKMKISWLSIMQT